LPEIQTLLEGITVGGHKLSDQQIGTNQGDACRYVFGLIHDRTFSVTSQVACDIHAIAGKEEALAWSAFRSGMVSIVGTDYMPPAPELLAERYDELVNSLDSYPGKIFMIALLMCFYVWLGIRFFGVNKRMGYFMMNSILLDSGYLAVNLPIKRKLELNTQTTLINLSLLYF